MFRQCGSGRHAVSGDRRWICARERVNVLGAIDGLPADRTATV
jgi:hypothetical protein